MTVLIITNYNGHHTKGNLSMEKLGLDEYIFPVEQRSVDLSEVLDQHDIGQSPGSEPGYKVILRADTGEIISVVRNSYHLITNEELISQFFSELRKRDIPAFADYSHSYVNNRQMRFQITLPDINFEDGESEISLAVFLHNSYDATVPVRIVFGAIRLVCANGMVITESKTGFTLRHVARVKLDSIVARSVSAMINEWSLVEDRVRTLAAAPFDADVYDRIDKLMGKSWGKYLRSQQADTMWDAYNSITRHISGEMLNEERARHQQNVGRVFGL